MARRQSAYTQVLNEKQKEAEQLKRETAEHPAVEPAEQQNIQELKRLDRETAEQSTVETAEQQNIQELKQSNIETARQENVQMPKHLTSKTAKQQRIKATFYLEPEDIIAIDEMQTQRFKQQGKKPEKSELVSQAIQLLKQQNV